MAGKIGEGVPNIVIPTIRDRDFFSSFLNNWKEELKGCHLIVVEDRKKAEFRSLVKTHSEEFGYTAQVFDHSDISNDLGDDSWIISRKTDCVRNYGYLVAYRNKPLFIVTLDDDLMPEVGGHIQQFYNNLFTRQEQDLEYFSTMTRMLPRGKLNDFGTEVVVSHGGWLNVPDLDAKTQIKGRSTTTTNYTDFYTGLVPKGSYYSMCGMNLAWKPEWTKYMYFPLMGAEGGYPIDRCGDIWAGYYSKHKADKKSVGHYTGAPYCVHTRASNPWSNLKKETNAEMMGPEFIQYIIDGEEISEWETNKEYWKDLKKAYNIWEELIDEVQ